MASILKLDIVQDSSGLPALDVAKLASGGRYTRLAYVQTDAATYSFTTAWALGPVFAVTNGFKAGSLIKMSYEMPCRNDGTSWGGGYIEPQVCINGGAWQSLGSCGYDGGVMNLGNSAIGSYFNSLLIDPGQAIDFTVQFRFYLRSYDQTLVLNGSHDVNLISGTATLMPGNNGLQHFAHIIVEELAALRGVA